MNVPNVGLLRLIHLRELGGTTFPFLQGLSERRHNIAQLFSPYGVQLRWSGYDLSAAGLFSHIVNGIRSADMCFFDNLGTMNKPNVYIEIGIAHALGKPMIVSEYSGPTRKNTRKMPDTGSVPSDLQGLVRIQYDSYEQLCKQVYFGLPMFFERNGLSDTTSPE